MLKFHLMAGLLFISQIAYSSTIINGDEQFNQYQNLLTKRKIGIVANNASVLSNGQNIVEFLRSKQINIQTIFALEHGFSAKVDAGEAINSGQESGIKLVSLYGQHKQPTATDLAKLDLIIFDVQDVGVRYYTYISSLQKVLEAGAKFNKPILLLDRANPNSFYIDGPVLDKNYRSFVGMQTVPIVYGMTIGEYAKMLIGEHWLELNNKQLANLRLTIIPIKNYTHASLYTPPQPPSPNLPNLSAIYWYPSLGWFEGTKLSVGRGTAMPFQVLGSPVLTSKFSFIPQSVKGAQNPPFLAESCFGWDLRMSPTQVLNTTNKQIKLSYLIQAYQQYPDKKKFFQADFFDKLAGNSQLRQQIIAGESEEAIRRSWQIGLNKFKLIRAKYLLYPDH
ncbi:MAG: hypothetical protein RLZZ293_474 [Pseudomonadota bacterium]